MRQASRAPGADSARGQLQRLVSWLERNGHAAAASSLREGREETLTILKLKVPSTLRRWLSTTNAIENLMSAIRRTTRPFLCWKNGSMIRRLVALATLDTQKRFRRLSEAMVNTQRDTSVVRAASVHPGKGYRGSRSEAVPVLCARRASGAG